MTGGRSPRFESPMKVTIIARYTPGALRYFEKKVNPKEDSYEEALEKVFAQLGDNNFFIKKELEKRGHQVQFLVYNWELGYDLLAKEWNIEDAQDSRELLIEQIERYQPNILFVGSFFELYRNTLPELKNKTSSRIISWISCPLPQDLELKAVDKVFTGLPPHEERFKGLGIDTEVKIIGFPSDLKLTSTAKNFDVGFIGAVNGLFTKEKYHNYRTELLKILSRNITVDKWGYGFKSTTGFKSALKKALRDPALLKDYHGEIWGFDMLKKLAQFRIGLNCHGEVAGDHAVNHRIFETTGVGSLLLTDEKKFLSRYFEPGKEVVTYSSPEDCLKKIKWLLKHPEKIEEISAAGKNRTLSDYKLASFVDRLEQSF